MASKYEGFVKLFLQITIDDNEPLAKLLDSYQRKLLNGKIPYNASHITLLVLSIKTGTVRYNYFTSKEFLIDVKDIYEKELKVKHYALELSKEYSVVGSNPECFIINLGPIEILNNYKINIINILCSKFQLVAKLNDENPDNIYTEYRSKIDDCIVFTSSINSGNIMNTTYHTTIVTSFDIKNHNKKLYKVYRENNNKCEMFLTEINKIIPDIDEKIKIDFSNTSILISFKVDNNFIKYK